MKQLIIKRDGTQQLFNKTKIQESIRNCLISFTSFNRDYVEYIDIDNFSNYATICVLDELENELNITVDIVQDIVVKILKEQDEEIGNYYEEYRQERDKKRNKEFNNIMSSIVNVEKNDITNSNANMNSQTPAGMMMKFAEETSKKYGMEHVLNKEYRQIHEEGSAYIHDFDYYNTKSCTCLQHPLNEILNQSWRVNHASTRACKDISSAFAIAAISLQTVQSEMHGGQAIPSIDFMLAPFVRKTFEKEYKEICDILEVQFDEIPEIPSYKMHVLCTTFTPEQRALTAAINKTVEKTRQGAESFIHNMNTMHSRGGNQVVFSSINYGIDISAEGRLVTESLLKATIRGVGDGDTPIFPIQIFQSLTGVNYLPDDPNYDLYQLACECCAKRFFPNVLNLDATFNNPGEKFDVHDRECYKHLVDTMGCRTRVFEDIHGENTSVGRGNLSFTTLVLPHIALLAKEQAERENDNVLDVFFELLAEKADICIEQLYDRYLWQGSAKAIQFPLLMSGYWVGSEKLKPNDTVKEVLKHGTLGLGFVGLAECLVALIGKHHGESEEAQELGLRICRFLNDQIDAAKREKNLNYSLLATPAESLAGKACQKDRAIFGVIPGVTDKDYYTNSNHVPVWYQTTMKHKAEIEGPYHDLTRGGHIFYVETDSDIENNPWCIMNVVDEMKKNNIGYGSINHTIARCLDCNFTNADKNMTECPHCGSKNVSVIQRITGYLVGDVRKWNSGKSAELKDRIIHGNIENK